MNSNSCQLSDTYPNHLQKEISSGISIVGKSLGLDLGCGRGGWFGFLSDKMRCETIIAVDIQLDHLLASKRSSGDRIDLIRADARKLPLKVGAFDLIFLAFLLHHVSQMIEVLTECTNLLSKSGTFVSIDPNGDNLLVKLVSKFRNVPWPWFIGTYSDSRERPFSPGLLKKLCAVVGLSILSARFCSVIPSRLVEKFPMLRSIDKGGFLSPFICGNFVLVAEKAPGTVEETFEESIIR